MFRRLIFLFGIFLLLTGVASAQDSLPLDQLVIGQIAAAGGNATYRISATSGQTLQIEVAEVTTGLAPQFTINNSSGAFVQGIGNPSLETGVKAVMTFTQSGEYFVSVSSANGTTGQFVIRISNAVPAPAPVSLPVGQPVNGSLSSSQQIIYAVTSGQSELVLSIEGGVSATLANAAGEIVATIAGGLNGGAFYLPANVQTYQLQLSNDSEAATINYTVALNPRGATVPAATPTPPTVATPGATQISQPVLPTTGDCVIATLRAEYVNVRTGPGTEFERITTIDPQRTYSVVGRTGDSSWYQINYGSGSGWVAGFVTRRGGDCSNLPVTYTPPTAVPSQPSGQIAGDNEWRGVQLPFEKGFSVGNSGQISYPNGDREDTISYNIIQVPSSIPSNSQFRYRIRCTGDYQYAQVQFSDGSTADCTPDGSNYVVYFNSNSDRVGSFTIKMTGGDNAFVQWNVHFSWYIP